MERKRRLIALLLSIVIVGAGQLYRRRYITGIIFLLIVVSSALFYKAVWTGFNYWVWWVIFSWIVLWIVNIIDAYKGPFYETAPCEDACPAGIKTLDYVTLIASHRFGDAYKIIAQTTPFVATLGRICNAPCEDKCARSGIDNSIAIRYIKRIIATKSIWSNSNRRQSESPGDELMFPTLRDKKIAVIGSGPCGLTCAYELRKKGYKVVIFEKHHIPGGMLTQCIQEFRLPLNIVEGEINLIKKSGIELRTNVEVGKDITFKDIEKEFDAMFIATGASVSGKLNITGENLDRVYYAIEFLKSIKLGHRIELGTKVVVIGGGNVAIDTARTASRLGTSKVYIVCLESRNEMLAFESEIQRAIEEQIEIHPSWGVTKIVGEKMVRGIEMIRCTSVFDAKGKFNPTFDTSIKTSIDCNTVIIAIGQKPDLKFIPQRLVDRIQNSRSRWIKNLDRGIFIGGDIVTGPSTVVSAIRAGKQGAKFIDRYLRGWKSRLDDWFEFYGPLPIGKVENAAWLEKKPTPRPKIEIPLITDRSGFDEVEIDCPEEQIIKEAKRCLKCSF